MRWLFRSSPPRQPAAKPAPARARYAALSALIGSAAVVILVPTVQGWEGREHTAYLDVVKVWTICDGDTKDVRPGQVASDAECDQRLERQLIAHARPVMECVPGLTRNRPYQLAASASLAYNIGTSAFCRSTVAKRFNRGDWRGGCNAFLMWNRAGGREVKGLTRRRQDERSICLRGLERPASIQRVAFQASIVEPDFVKYPGVVQVICDKGLGTAFRIAPGRLVSVAHVTSQGPCEVEDAPILVNHEGPGQDFSLLTSPKLGRDFLRINCGGVHAGDWLWSVGYARGWPKQQRIVLRATGRFNDSGMAELLGLQTVIPGMSGGPVFNRAGEVVATVNAFNPFFRTSYVRALKDTALCTGAIA